jgi:hypothetical protein
MACREWLAGGVVDDLRALVDANRDALVTRRRRRRNEPMNLSIAPR